jgi:hypothetical protein
MTPEQAFELAWQHRLDMQTTQGMGYSTETHAYCTCGVHLDFERNYLPHLRAMFGLDPNA